MIHCPKCNERQAFHEKIIDVLHDKQGPFFIECLCGHRFIYRPECEVQYTDWKEYREKLFI